MTTSEECTLLPLRKNNGTDWPLTLVWVVASTPCSASATEVAFCRHGIRHKKNGRAGKRPGPGGVGARRVAVGQSNL